MIFPFIPHFFICLNQQQGKQKYTLTDGKEIGENVEDPYN